VPDFESIRKKSGGKSLEDAAIKAGGRSSGGTAGQKPAIRK